MIDKSARHGSSQAAADGFLAAVREQLGRKNFDGVAELWFDDLDALDAARGSAARPSLPPPSRFLSSSRDPPCPPS